MHCYLLHMYPVHKRTSNSFNTGIISALPRAVWHRRPGGPGGPGALTPVGPRASSAGTSVSWRPSVPHGSPGVIHVELKTNKNRTASTNYENGLWSSPKKTISGFAQSYRNHIKSDRNTKPQGVFSTLLKAGAREPSLASPDISTRRLPRDFLRYGCGPPAGRASPQGIHGISPDFCWNLMGS